MASVTVQFGRLSRVIGRPAKSSGLVFVAVLAELQNEPAVEWRGACEMTPEYGLAVHTSDEVPHYLAACQLERYGSRRDAMWVRARIPAIFHFAPVSLREYDCKYALLQQPFVACEPNGSSGDWVAYPFVCQDYDLRTGLRFSADGPAHDVRERIAHAFWGLLLNEPDVLHPFHDGYLMCYPDMGDIYWQAIAFVNGHFTVDEVPIDPPRDDDDL